MNLCFECATAQGLAPRSNGFTGYVGTCDTCNETKNCADAGDFEKEAAP